MTEFKVGDMVRSVHQEKKLIYCIFRINKKYKLAAVLTSNGNAYSYFDNPQSIFRKVNKTKKRKKLFLKAFKKELLKQNTSNYHGFTNLDYVEVVSALTHE